MIQTTLKLIRLIGCQQKCIRKKMARLLFYIIMTKNGMLLHPQYLMVKTIIALPKNKQLSNSKINFGQFSML